MELVIFEPWVKNTLDSIECKMPELRDLFAINAMNAIIGNHTNSNLDDIFSEYVHNKVISSDEEVSDWKESSEKLATRDWIAMASYLMADAMIQARKKKN